MATTEGTGARLASVMIDVASGKAKGTQIDIDNIHREHFKAKAIEKTASVAIEGCWKKRSKPSP